MEKEKSVLKKEQNFFALNKHLEFFCCFQQLFKNFGENQGNNRCIHGVFWLDIFEFPKMLNLPKLQIHLLKIIFVLFSFSKLYC